MFPGWVQRWLNSNKGTKREIGFYIRPFRPWISALFATPKNVSLWSASFGGVIPTVSCSFSSEKSYSPSRLMCCQETAEPLATASRNAAEQGPNLSDGTSGGELEGYGSEARWRRRRSVS